MSERKIIYGEKKVTCADSLKKKTQKDKQSILNTVEGDQSQYFELFWPRS